MTTPQTIMPGPTAADPLGEALHFLRMTGVFYCRSELTAPWGIDLPPMKDCMMLHLVTAGECILTVAGAEPCPMGKGDFVLVPHGEGHRLAGAADSHTVPLFDLPRDQVSERYEILRCGGGGAPTEMLCTGVRFEHPAAFHLLELLPKVIRVSVDADSGDRWVPVVMDLIEAEAKAMKPGGETVITRLADTLVIHVIRAWMARETSRKGWLAALRDPKIGHAIALVHREPAREWSVGSLAGAVAMSRSAFAARFTELVGEPAMRYVTRWRMRLALAQLKEGKDTLFEMADRLGYRSEAAFSRAFKRYMGVSPGVARKRL